MIKTISKLEITNRQPDLLYLEAIFASTGPNKNYCFFDPQELLAAKLSPINKPLDWEHHAEENDAAAKIIGTVTDSWIEDLAGNKLVAIELKDLPSEFNIVVSAVIWRYLYSETAELVEKRFEDSELFCSLEAWYPAYDYALRTDAGFKIIKRNKATAALDNYLIQRNGEGVFNGKKLLVVPRNIIFGGMGIVKKPANKLSEVRELASNNSQTVVSENLDATNIIEKILFV